MEDLKFSSAVLTKNLVASTLIIFWLACPKMRVRPTKISSQANQIPVWLSKPPQKVGKAYKISMSVIHK